MSAVQARVRRLESRGVITGYAAAVDHEALGLPLAAFVAITPLDPAQPDDAPQRLTEARGHRGLLLGRRGGALPAAGARRLAAGAGGRAAGDPGAGERRHADDGRAADVLRTPPAGGRSTRNQFDATGNFPVRLTYGRKFVVRSRHDPRRRARLRRGGRPHPPGPAPARRRVRSRARPGAVARLVAGRRPRRHRVPRPVHVLRLVRARHEPPRRSPTTRPSAPSC